jgi:predicted DCC family thiol-disulfide oxidoreductase YuxK
MKTPNAHVRPAALFYDGRCSICTKELDRLGRMKNEGLELIDIHAMEPDADLPAPDALLRVLHLRTSDGSFLKGVDANVAAWSFTSIGPFFKWMQWPIIAPVFNIFYTRWARWRYDRLYSQACSARGA